MSTSSSSQIVDVTLHGQRDFAEVIKLRILSWRGYPGGPNVSTSITMREARGSEREGNVTNKGERRERERERERSGLGGEWRT